MMAKKFFQSNYYQDVTIHVCNIDDSLVQEFVLSVLAEEQDPKVRLWYSTGLADRDIKYFLVSVVDGVPISGCGTGDDGKILRYLYTLPEYRNKYRGLAQIDYTPIFVELADRDTLYLSIDAFDEKHRKLAKAWDRVILSGVPAEKQPYRAKWKYIGIYKYRGTQQHFYELKLND